MAQAEKCAAETSTKSLVRTVTTYDELFLSSTATTVLKKGEEARRNALLRATSRSHDASLHTPDSAIDITGHDPVVFINYRDTSVSRYSD